MQNKSLLFTCMGTSDPVRGYRDGPMLHILRKYRPEKVIVFLTKEAAELAQTDNRLQAVFRHISSVWKDYAPTYEVIHAAIDDPSDLDAVAYPMEECLLKAIKEYPHGEILLNLSSGTPQMKQVLTMFAADARYSQLRGIQVKNPEKAAGKSERTNLANYSTADELECNEDDFDDQNGNGCPNRCVEPMFLYQKRKQAADRIRALIAQRQYSAVAVMKNALPDYLMALVRHLEARDQLNDTVARDKAKNLKLPFSLYPAKPSKNYAQISEVYLVLLNRLHRAQYEELVLRLNPLIVHLYIRLLEQALQAGSHPLRDIVSNPYGLRPMLQAESLRQAYPQAYDALSESVGRQLRDETDMGIHICYTLLNAMPNANAEVLRILNIGYQLNSECRNRLAHQLTALTKEQFRAACGMEPKQLMRQIGDAIKMLYPECDPKFFAIYEKCDNYIVENLP